jgi:serine/threonine-protein kinase
VEQRQRGERAYIEVPASSLEGLPMTAASEFTVLQPLGGDARHEASLVDTPSGRFVLKVVRPQVTSSEAFLEQAHAVSTLNHAGVRAIRQAGALGDGRRYALVDVVDEPTLAASAPLTVERALEVGVALADTLSVLHHAGVVVGEFNAGDVFIGASTRLDVSLSGLASGATTASDTAQLKRLVLASAPFDVGASERLTRAATASQVKSVLLELQLRHSDTAVSAQPACPVEVEVVEPDFSGNTLGNWKLEKIIGEGAMGRVYLGTHNRIGRKAAVKVLKAEHASSTELVHRFIQEAQAVNAIKNEHIVEVYDFGELAKPDGARLVYCVMELLEGEALAETLNRGPITVQRTARIGMQLAQALAAAHQVGVIHRDVKPENIFLHLKGDDPDYVKVLDFGVAKLLKPIGDLPSSGTLAGIVVGTPEYMAPEQALGVSVDMRSDLYAVGLVLYELITGVQPFQADTFGKLVVEITQKPVPPMPQTTRLGEVMPRGMASIILKCLQKEPEARFQSGLELARALKPHAEGTADPMKSQSMLTPVPEPELVLPARSRLPMVLVGVVVLGAAVAVALLLSPWKSAPAEVPAPVVTPVPVEPPPTVVAKVGEPVAAPATLEVATTPAGATVTRVDTGALLGRTPLKLPTSGDDGTVTLAFALDGYEAQQREVNLSKSVQLSLDLRPTKKAEPVKPVPKRPGKKASVNGTVNPFDP